MALKPIFAATHPRACSTAFERVFMARRDKLQCVHEPFGDAYYFGPERLHTRYEDDEEARNASGFIESTYKAIFDRLEREGSEGKRVFIKDMLNFLSPPDGQAAQIAPSLGGIPLEQDHQTNGVNGVNGTHKTNGVNGVNGVNGTNGVNGHHKKLPFPYGTHAEPGNPTVVPLAMLKQFHFVFLIRHPRRSIPSFYRCTVPPLDKVTGWDTFLPNEAGYDEMRRTFDYLREQKLIGPAVAGKYEGSLPEGQVAITVVDADDLLDSPETIIRTICKETGLDFTEDMLNWNEESQQQAKEAFEKWNGFHDDAIASTCLKPRTHKKKAKTEEEEDAEWREKFGPEAQKLIRETVNANVADYEYLKSFAIAP